MKNYTEENEKIVRGCLGCTPFAIFFSGLVPALVIPPVEMVAVWIGQVGLSAIAPEKLAVPSYSLEQIGSILLGLEIGHLGILFISALATPAVVNFTIDRLGIFSKKN